MPTISVFFGIVIRMFWQDHDPPHFHARYAEHKARFTIEPVAQLDDTFLVALCTWSWSGRNSIGPSCWTTGIDARGTKSWRGSRLSSRKDEMEQLDAPRRRAAN